MLFFDELLYQQVHSFNPLYEGKPGELAGRLHRLQANIFGNRQFLTYLRNDGKYYQAVEKRWRDLILIDYDDADKNASERRNVYKVTEEFTWHNGHHGNREDVVFIINGIPVVVVEC